MSVNSLLPVKIWSFMAYSSLYWFNQILSRVLSDWCSTPTSLNIVESVRLLDIVKHNLFHVCHMRYFKCVQQEFHTLPSVKVCEFLGHLSSHLEVCHLVFSALLIQFPSLWDQCWTFQLFLYYFVRWFTVGILYSFMYFKSKLCCASVPLLTTGSRWNFVCVLS